MTRKEVAKEAKASVFVVSSARNNGEVIEKIANFRNC